MSDAKLCIAAILCCLYLALRSYRPALAWAEFAAGFVAAYSYLTAIVLVPVLLVTGLLMLRGCSRLQAIIPAAGCPPGYWSTTRRRGLGRLANGALLLQRKAHLTRCRSDSKLRNQRVTTPAP